jgi:hypothetical protein
MLEIYSMLIFVCASQVDGATGLDFWAVVAPALAARAAELNAQELSMSCWAASHALGATSHAASGEPAAVAALVAALGAAAAAACGHGTLARSPQQVATVALALAKLGCTNRTHLAALSHAARNSDARASLSISSSNSSHSNSHSSSSSSSKSSSHSSRGRPCGLGRFGWVDLDNLASGFARHELQWRSPKLVAALSKAAANLLAPGAASTQGDFQDHASSDRSSHKRPTTHRSSVCPPRNVANVLTSVAKLASTCKQLPLATTLALAACHRLRPHGDHDEGNDVSSFNLRDCANAAWGLAVLGGGLGHQGEEFEALQACVAALGRRGAQCLGQQVARFT